MQKTTITTQMKRKSMSQRTVADLEIFRGGFRFKKTPAKIEVKTKKKKKKKGSSLAFWIIFFQQQ